MTNNSAPDTTPAQTDTHRPSARRKGWGAWVVLLVALILGTYFRTIALTDWDEPSYRLHPDERFMVMVANNIMLPPSWDSYIDSSLNTLNPRNRGHTFYVYGTFPQFLTRYVAVGLTPNEQLPQVVPYPFATENSQLPQVRNPELDYPKIPLLGRIFNPDQINLTDYYEIYKVGRSLSTLLDIGSILLSFLIASRLFNRRVGALAALLYALSVLPIQLSHFFAVDTFTSFFTLLAVYWAVRIGQRGGFGSYVGLGLSVGAAMASRVTLATVGLLGLVALVQYVWLRQIDPERERRPNWFYQFAMLGMAGALSVLTFRVLQPDAFMGTHFFDLRLDERFVSNIKEISMQVSGAAEAPPAQQWANRPPFWFAIKNMMLWGMGLPFGVTAWVTWLVVGVMMVRKRWFAPLIPWSGITLYYAWQGDITNPTMRYFLVLYAPFAILSAWALISLWDGRSKVQSWPWLRFVQFALPVFVVLGTLTWAYAFTRVYTKPHSRVTASRWIYENIPPGAALTSETWDDPLPLNLDGRSSQQYIGVTMHPYHEDDPEKYTGNVQQDGTRNTGLFDQLEMADYVILSSNRVYDSTSRLPMRFPALTRYYHYLFNGELGFDLVADIHSYPSLFGIDIPDQSSEEAFTVYDHPRVLIFKKNASFSRERAERLITDGMTWGEVYKMRVAKVADMPTALRFTPSTWSLVQQAGTWSELFNPQSLSNKLPWLSWLLMLELLGMVTFALLFRLFPKLPDRGYSLSKTLGLLIVAFSAWFLASYRWINFGPGTLWLLSLVLALVGVLSLRGHFASFKAFIAARRKSLLAAEVLFLVAFFGFLLIRALNPDLWHPARGGEKPMDLAFFNAILKSESFPPYDPWYAGGFINYYYFGFVLVATLTHLTGIVPSVAYNLAIPTIFALTALGAWGAAFNLIASRRAPVHVDASRPAPTPSRRWRAFERRAIISGIAAAIFVVLAGNLANALWMLPGSSGGLDPNEPAHCDLSSYAAKQECKGRKEWAFWDATRIVSMALSKSGQYDGTINEFPYFTFLYGDLHAHMIALALAVTALGLMVALFRGRSQQHAGLWQQLGAQLPALALLALTTGALRATNTWDFPAYAGLSILTLFFIAWRYWRRGTSWKQATLLFVLGAAIYWLLGSLLFWPFLTTFATDYAGFELWKGRHTPLRQYLQTNGVWLFIVCSAGLGIFNQQYRLRLWHWLLVLAAGCFVVAGIIEDVPALYMILPIAVAVIALGVEVMGRGEWVPNLQTDPETGEQRKEWLMLEPRASLSTIIPSLWATSAIWLTLLVELIVSKGDIGRMNTVFKLGMQSWVLFAIAAGIGLVWIWEQVRNKQAGIRVATVAGWVWRGAAAVLIAAAMVFPATATPARLADRYDTSLGMGLDGSAYLKSPKATWGENNYEFSFAEDAAAIEWLQQNIEGTPIILEAHTEAYRWGARIANNTGLPTLIGWHHHVRQQRAVAQADYVIDNRRSVVQQIYTTPDSLQALSLIQQYGVEYIIVGHLEQALYRDSGGLAKFEQMAQNGQLQRSFQSGSTTIYRALPGSSSPVILTTELSVATPSIENDGVASLGRAVSFLPTVNDYAWNKWAASEPLAVVVWLIVWYGLLFLGLPASLLLFGNVRQRLKPRVLPDEEALEYALEQARSQRTNPLEHAENQPMLGVIPYMWARLLGLLLLAYVVWLCSSAGLLLYDLKGVWIGVGLVALLNIGILALLGHLRTCPSNEGNERRRFLRNYSAGVGLVGDLFGHYRVSLLLFEGLFVIAFFVMMLIRMFNPDLWHPYLGGEKPFEFGFLNAILRSGQMPPYDPFYSDHSINYYYYGLYLASLPIKATGIAPAIGFNLFLASLYAMTISGAFAVGLRLTNKARYGLVAVFLLAVLGNVAAAFKVGTHDGFRPIQQAIESSGWQSLGRSLGYWFWNASRVISIPDELTTINEFSYWSFLFGDLHPHLIALPITILAVALAYELFSFSRKHNSLWAFVAQSIGTAFVLGTIAVTNSWDMPTYGLLVTGALLGSAWRSRGQAFPWQKLLGAGLLGLLIMGAALVFYLPFFQHFHAQVGGIGRVEVNSPLKQYALMYGLFFGILLPFVYSSAWRIANYLTPKLAGQTKRGLSGWHLALLLVPLFLIYSLSFANRALQIWLVILMILIFALLLLRKLKDGTWFILWLTLVALAVSFGVELIYIKDHLDGGSAARMNTVFKFGYQIWTLLALASAAALAYLGAWLDRRNIAWTIASTMLLGVLVAMASLFPIFGSINRLSFRFEHYPGLTLDGLKFMETAEFDVSPSDLGLVDNGVPVHIALRGDAAAIKWINENIEGTPIIAQSDLWFYRAYGTRIAANTGFPTIVSPLHASEQHDPQAVGERSRHLTTLFATTSSEQALQILSKYRVGYVYVGQIERAAYGEAGANKFEQMVGSYLSLEYSADGVQIYKVNEGVYSIVPSLINSSTQPIIQLPVNNNTNNQTNEDVGLSQLEEQVRQNPSNASLAFGLGQRYGQMGRFDDAVRVLQAAAAANPSDIGLHHLLGDMQVQAGDNEGASNTYRLAAQASPTANNFNKLGTHLLNIGQLDEASEVFLQAINVEPEVTAPYFHLGEIYELRGDTTRALEQYTMFLERAQSDDPLWPFAQEAFQRLQ